MIKTKIFAGSPGIDLENKINYWFKEHPHLRKEDCDIIVKQSATSVYLGLSITVIYETETPE